MILQNPTTWATLLALAGGGLILYIFIAPRRRPATLDLVRDARQQLLANTLAGPTRPGIIGRIHAAVRQRLAQAGLAWVPTRYFLLATVLLSFIGLDLLWHIFVAPVFALLGLLGGAYIPWAFLEEAGSRMRTRIDGQVVELLNLLEYAASSNRSAMETFLEMASLIKARPLATYIDEARVSIDPREGLGGQSFLTVLTMLDRNISHPWFHRAYRVLVAGQQRGTPIRDSLAYAADDAREAMAAAVEARTEYVQIRTQTGIMYGMVLLVTLAQQMLVPTTVKTFYSSTAGAIVAVGLTALCVYSYRHVVHRERTLLAETRGESR